MATAANGTNGGALTIQQKTTNVRALLDKSKGQIAMALPKHCTPERMLRVAMTAIQRVPQLLECDPRTLVARVVEASQLGLEPDGVLGHAYLVPFRNGKTGKQDCQLIPGYKGLVELARRSGQVSTIYAKVVHAKDRYKISYGLDPQLTHTPADEDDPGEIIAAYAVCRLRDGGVQFEWLWKREIDAVRKRSKASGSGPWVTDYDEMAKKTVLRRLCKLLPVSVELQRLAAADENFDAGRDPEPPSADIMGLLPPEPKTSSLDALTARFDGPDENDEREPDGTEEPPFNPPTEAEVNEDEAITLNEWREHIAGLSSKIEVAKAQATAQENASLSEGLKAKIVCLCEQRALAIGAARGQRTNGG